MKESSSGLNLTFINGEEIARKKIYHLFSRMFVPDCKSVICMHLKYTFAQEYENSESTVYNNIVPNSATVQLCSQSLNSLSLPYIIFLYLENLHFFFIAFTIVERLQNISFAKTIN